MNVTDFVHKYNGYGLTDEDKRRYMDERMDQLIKISKDTELSDSDRTIYFEKPLSKDKSKAIETVGPETKDDRESRIMDELNQENKMVEVHKPEDLYDRSLEIYDTGGPSIYDTEDSEEDYKKRTKTYNLTNALRRIGLSGI